MASLKEALDLVDEAKRELSFYDKGSYKQLLEQTQINKAKDLLEKAKACIMAKDVTDGTFRADKLSPNDWRKITDLMTPLARCFTLSTPPPVAPTTKTRHSAATAVAALALLSSCNNNSKLIVTEALETGVVDAFVSTLNLNLSNPTTDRVIKAMLYKLIESLWGFTLYASTQHQQDMVTKGVVNVCLDLVTSPNVEMESRLNANKTLHNCLNSQGRVVKELRNSKVTALNNLLQQLALQVPVPAAAATLGGAGGGSGASKNISMPVLLPAVISWIWLLPDYILDHLLDSLARTLGRVVALVWPVGCADVPSQPAGASETGPALVAQNSLPNRSLQKTLQNLFKAIGSGIADPRLVVMLRGAQLPAPEGADPTELNAEQALQGTGLPARLVQVVREGRPDGQETKVALELLDELFACNDNGFYPELADDAIAAGLLGSMTEMGVLESLRTEAGLPGVSAYVRLALKLVKRAPYTHNLPTCLRESGVPASVAYVAFWPTGKWSLKLEALQTLYEMVQQDHEMTERVVVMNNFPTALTNTLLGGDPELRKPAKKSGGGPSKKKAGSAAAAAAAAAADSSAPNSASRNAREQIQDLAFEILSVVLEVAHKSEKVWETVVVSGMLPRLVQHSCAFPMKPLLLADLLGAVAAAFKDHSEDISTVGPLQAACAPHLLPLLLHEDPGVMEAAAKGLLDILKDMKQYRSDSVDVAEGDDILKALVAAGPAIDSVAKLAMGPGGRGDAAAGTSAVAEDPEGAGRSEVMDVDAAPGPSSAGGKAAGPRARGANVMDAHAPAASAAAGRTSAAAVAGADLAGTSTAADTAEDRAISTAAANADAAAAAEALQSVDVTAIGLGLICRAMQSCISRLLHGSDAGASASPLVAGSRDGSAVSTASSPRLEGVAKPAADGESASAARAPAVLEVLEGPVFEALEALLESCELLGGACLEMPSHGAVRRHLACALAYAKPAAAVLASALQAVPEPTPSHRKLQQHASEVVGVLQRIPVLDVVLLPKPKEEEDEETLPAPSPGAPSRKGRSNGSSKRPSQDNLPAAVAATQPAQQPNKRQRTSSVASAAAAAEAGPGPLSSTRSASLAQPHNGEGAVALTPRASARAASAAGAGQSTDTNQTAAAAPARGATAGLEVSPEGQEGRAAARRGPPAGRSVLPAPAPAGAGPLPEDQRAGGVADLPGRRDGLPGGGGAAAAGPLSRAGSEGPGAVAAAGGATTTDPVMPAQPVDVGGAGGLGLPLPTAVKAPSPKVDTAAAQLPPLSCSPSVAKPERRTSQRALMPSTTHSASQMIAAAAAATGTAGGGQGGGGGAAVEAPAAAKGRVNAAEFRARYLEMKAQVARMASELEEQKRARNDAETRQRETAATLATRTQELQQARGELRRKARELDATRQELDTTRQEQAALRAELQEAREATSAASAAVAEANEGLRELELLRAENAGLREENAKLNSELASLADLDEVPIA